MRKSSVSLATILNVGHIVALNRIQDFFPEETRARKEQRLDEVSLVERQEDRAVDDRVDEACFTHPDQSAAAPPVAQMRTRVLTRSASYAVGSSTTTPLRGRVRPRIVRFSW